MATPSNRPSRPKSGADAYTIKPGVAPKFWFDVFQKALIPAIIEMVKNAFDWRSHTVRFITNEARTLIRYIDDGVGMSAQNREAFLSVGKSTAGEEQSGQFGSGAEYLIFSFASHVVLLTAPAEDPTVVYRMEFTPHELAETYSGQRGIDVQRLPKTAKTWPHEHPFGTEIAYTLKEPGSRSIYRGERLAEKLSQRLDNVFVEGGLVHVDGSPLPKKQMAAGSRPFSISESLPGLGVVRLEFYRPARKSSEEDLWMTDRSVGEVSFRRAFAQLLNEEQRDMIPSLFMESEVCGLIAAGFLHDHVAESRVTYRESVKDDERVNELLRYLIRVEQDVAAHLGIKLRNVDNLDASGRQEVEEFVESLRKRYNPHDEAPEAFTGEEIDIVDAPPSEDTTGGRPRKPTAPSLQLDINRTEFEPDEHIVIKLTVPPDKKVQDYNFYTDLSRAKVLRETDDELELVATELGQALVSAINTQTGDSVKVEYEVVPVRKFHLSARGPITLTLGSSIALEAVNADRLKGDLRWSLAAGRGELKVTGRGRRVRFTPTHVGRARVTAIDTVEPSNADHCEILVQPAPQRETPFRIREHFFSLQFQETNLASFGKIATIIKAGEGEVHRLVFNLWAPGYTAAVRAGTIRQALIDATSFEYAKQFLVDWDEVSSNDLESIITMVQNEAAKLVEEML